jgi:hypothetical protein
MKNRILTLILLVFNFLVFATDYTFVSGRPNVLTNWSPTPPNFTTPGDKFIINSSALALRFNEEWIVIGEVIVNSNGIITKNNVVTGGDTTARNIQIGTLTINGGTVNYSSGTLKSLAPNYNINNLVINFGIFNKTSTALLSVTNLTITGGTMALGGIANNTINTTTVNSSGIFNITSNLTLNVNSITINSGGALNFTTANSVINGTTFTLSSGGSIRVSAVAGLTSDATSHIRTTTRNFSTGANYTFTQTGGGVFGDIFPTTVNNLNVSKTSAGTYILNNNLIVNGDLTISNLASIQVNAGYILRVNGNVINNGTNNTNYPIRLRSTGVGAGGQGYLNIQGTTSGTGVYRIERFVQGAGSPGAPSGKGNYVSPPISDGNSGVFSASGLNRLFSYNENTNNWNAEINDDVTSINAGRGYAFRPNANTTLNFIGTINNGTISFPIPAVNNRWSLVGNPYPCTIDWGLDESHNWTQSGMRSTIWVSVGNADNTVHSYNRIGGVASSPTITRYIAPGQAFWVLTSSTSASLSCNNSVKVDDTRAFIRQENPNNKLFRLAIKQAEIIDECLVYFNENGEDEFDEGDSEKFDVHAPNVEIYSIIDNTKLSIDRRKNIANQIIPIGITIKAAGNYQIINHENSLPSNIHVFIEDLEQNTFTKFEDIFEFASNSVKNNHRFNLHFIDNTSTLVENLSNNKLNVFHVGKTIFIAGNKGNKQISLYDLNGKIILEKTISGFLNRIDVEVPIGTYILKAVENNRITSKKMIF